MGWFDTVVSFFTGPSAAPLTEAPAPGFGFDPDSSHTAAQMGAAYARRLTGAAQRDLQPLEQKRMIDLAYWLSENNPLAKSILEGTRDYVLGDGVTVEATGDDEALKKRVQKVIDAFWDDPINQVDLKLAEKVRELGMFGEYLPTVWVNPVDGRVRLGYIDPGNVVEIITDPRNIEVPVMVTVNAPAGGPPERFKVVMVDEKAGSKTYGRRIGVTTDRAGNVLDTYDSGAGPQPFAGAVLVYRINQATSASRGRSDLLTVMNWMDAYDQQLFDEVDRAALMKSHIWDVILKGATEKQVNEWLAKNAAPKPGSIRAHNESEEWTAQTPDLKVADASKGADLVLSYISTGSRQPKHWLNGIMDVNLATASAMGEPAIKHLTYRQRYVRYIISDILTFALDQAELKGQLPKRAAKAGQLPAPWQFDVNMPEISGTDLKGAAETLVRAVTGLSKAVLDGMVDIEVAQQVLVLLVGQFGVDVDLPAMRKRIEKTQAEREAKAAEMAKGIADQSQDGVQGEDTPPNEPTPFERAA